MEQEIFDNYSAATSTQPVQGETKYADKMTRTGNSFFTVPKIIILVVTLVLSIVFFVLAGVSASGSGFSGGSLKYGNNNVVADTISKTYKYTPKESGDYYISYYSSTQTHITLESDGVTIDSTPYFMSSYNKRFYLIKGQQYVFTIRANSHGEGTLSITK